MPQMPFQRRMRWVLLSGAPTAWVAADAPSWLASHVLFMEATAVFRVPRRGVSMLGPTMPIWSQNLFFGHRRCTLSRALTHFKSTVTQSVWGDSAPAPAAKPSVPAAAATVLSVVAATAVAPATGQAATGDAKARECTRSPPPTKEARGRSVACVD